MSFVYGERERVEVIPDPKPDPKAQAPVRVKAIKGFWWNRRIVNPGEIVTITRWAADDLLARKRIEVLEGRELMSDGKGAGNSVTCRARRIFFYNGQTIQPGDTITLPVAEYERLRLKSQGRCVEHILEPNLWAYKYSTYRLGIEWHFD